LPVGGRRAPREIAARHHAARRGRQVHRAEGLLQEPRRGPGPRRHRAPGESGHRLDGRRAHRARRRRRALRRHRRDPGAGRLRRPRHRGQDPVGALRARAARAVLRHLPRHAVRGDRIRAQRVRPGGRQLVRVHSRRPAPRDRSAARAADARRQGWHHAPRPLSDPGERGQPRVAPLRRGDHPRAPPPPLRGQQRLPQDAREERAVDLGHLGGEAAGRDHRDRGPPVLRGRPVPSRVPVAAVGPAPALRRLRQGRTGLPRPARMMKTREVRIGAITVGGGRPLVLIGGPCAIEDEKHALMTAERLATIAADRRVPYVYKSSYDKANRSSVHGYRGPGLVEGLRILKKVRDSLRVPVLSDIHQVSEVDPAAEVLDVLQIPAFLCRQTDLILAAAATGKPVNVKKGQFVAPRDMKNVVDKILSKGNESILLTERGTSFGYHNLVVDMRGLVDMRELGYPVVFDATHSVQLPGGAGDRSGGERKYVPALARAAVAFGVDALFMEMHEDPDRTLPDGRPLSDGPNMLRIDDLPRLLRELGAIEAAVHPAEGVHGDLGMVARGDVVLALSNSGETDEVLAILPPLKRLGVPIVLLTGNPTSSLARQCEVVLDVSVAEEACPMNLAPTSSTTAALAAGDALALALLDLRGLRPEDYAALHPRGTLGWRALFGVAD